MKKVMFVMLCLFSILFLTKNADAQVYQKDKSYLNVGFGVGSYYRGLPVGISYEYGFTDKISAGAFLDYSTSKYGYGFGYNGRLNVVYFGVRGSYHFNELLEIENNKVDVYGGLALGYTSVKWKYDNNVAYDYSDYSSGVLLGVHAGAKYMFSDNLGGYAELGYGVAILKLGLAVKF